MEAIVEMRGVTVVRGKKTVLRDVSLSIPKGEIYGLVGVSGSGKTTLISTIAGLVRHTRGDLKYHKPEPRRWIGTALQFPSVYPELTCTQNLQYFASMYGLKKSREELRLLLRKVGLAGSEDLDANKLSGGMQKKLDIACGIVHNPALLLLDEPTANLDPLNRDDIWKLVLELNKQGTTIIVSSHFLDEIEELCTRAAAVHQGVVKEIDNIKALRSAKKGRLHGLLEELAGK